MANISEEQRAKWRRYAYKYSQRDQKVCPNCGGWMNRHSQQCRKCHDKNQQREKNPNWKGGRIKNRNGYILLSLRGHPRTNVRHQVFEHIVIWENTHGPTPKGWQIHHINGVKDDNRLENLIALPPKTHHHESPIRQQLKKAQARIRELEQRLNHENQLL